MSGNQILAINATQAMRAVTAQTNFANRIESTRNYMIASGFRPRADGDMLQAIEVLGGDPMRAAADQVTSGTGATSLVLDLEEILWDAVFAQNPVGVLIKLKKGGDWTNPGHAICAYLQGGNAVFFDPNYGEFTFTKLDVPTFSNWLVQFLVKSDYVDKYPRFVIDIFDFTG